MMRRLMGFCLAVALAGQELKFETSSRLVVVNVTVRGKDGRPVEGLTKQDFHILEDGKPQTISVFEFQRLSGEKLPEVAVPKPEPAGEKRAAVPEVAPPKPSFRDRRLMVLFFDFSSLPQGDQIRAKDAAAQFLAKQMTSADLVAVYTYASQLKKLVDFTDDREMLLKAVQGFGVAQSMEFQSTLASDTDAPDDGSFLVDETEFAIFDTDRRLAALEDLAKELAPIPEKKAVIFFSSGVGKNGMDNQSQQQATVNAAVRAGISFYPLDVRGLVAMAPAGDASKSAAGGTSIFSGQAQRGQRDQFLAQQDTLFTLADDTGGKALLDSNDLTMGIRQAQQDVESYYTLAYYTTNFAKDGHYRKIKVEMASRKDLKLDYRPGYYADKVFEKFDSSDKERQLSEAMSLGNPLNELPIAVEMPYFRVEKGRYFVPVAVKIPGSKVGLKSGKTELDFIGTVKDAKGKTVASLRDTIKIRLKEGEEEKMAQRSLLYDAAFQLTPGEYQVKVLARENQAGKIGTFETKFRVPDLDAGPAAPVSSLVLATGREPLSVAVGSAGVSKKEAAKNPLVSDGKKLSLSVTRVYRRGQTLVAYGEVYAAESVARLSLYHGKQKVWESAPLRPAGKAVEVSVPLRRLPPGEYTCQLTVIEPTAQKFEVRRAGLTVTP